MISDTTLRRVLPADTVALIGDLVRALAWALIVIVWISFAQVYLRMIRLTLADPSSSDFTIFYFTARMVSDGLPMYGDSPARYGVKWAADHLGNLNPPHFQLLIVPLASLTYGQALLAWVATSFVCVTAAVRIILHELQVRFTWERFFLWGALTIAAAPFTTVAVTSEMTFVLMLPFALLWRAWRRGWWSEVGLWLGVCASLKLFFLLLVPWLIWRRRWTALGAAAATSAALVALGSIAFGLHTYALWLHSLGKVGWWWMAMNASWHGFVSRVFQAGGAMVPVVSAPALVRPLGIAGTGAIVAVTFWAVARLGERTVRDREHALLILLVAAILVSPLGWVYYLPLAYGPILGWLGAGEHWSGLRRLRPPVLWLLVAGLALLYTPQEVANAATHSALATLTLTSVYFWATVTLWSVLCSNLET